MEDLVLRHLRAGLPLLQQPYSTEAAWQVHEHLQDAAADRSQDHRVESKRWSEQKRSDYMVQVLRLIDLYLQWLLPVYDSGGLSTAMAVITTTSSSSSSSDGSSIRSDADGSSDEDPTPSGDQVYIHVGCIILCLVHSSGRLYAALSNNKMSAVVGAHLLKPTTGERQAARRPCP
jgi:hypothetical protein